MTAPGPTRLPKVAWKAAKADPAIASFRFRVQAPMGALRSRGHDVSLFEAEAAATYDVVVFSKTYSAADQDHARRLKDRGCRIIFDLCDNHFYNPLQAPAYEKAQASIRAMLTLADQVVCGSQPLADILEAMPEVAQPPLVIGDIAERLIVPSKPPSDTINLLWYGSHGSPNAPGGMGDLTLLSDVLARFAERWAAELTVLSNNEEKFAAVAATLPLPSRYAAWSPESHIHELTQADAVLIPVVLNPFTICKTHNRLSSALYAGRPTLATAIPSYQEFAPFCSLDDWDAGFERLAETRDAETRRALASRAYIDANWSAGAVAPQWEKALGLDTKSLRGPAARRRPARSAMGPDFHGQLDALAAGAVTGWARAFDPALGPVSVVLEVDGEAIAQMKADLPREDLRMLGLADHHCGFAFSLQGVDTSNPAALKVRIADVGDLVGEHPFVLKDVPAAEADRGLAAHDAAPRPGPALRMLKPAVTASVASADVDAYVAEVDDLLGQLRATMARSVVALAGGDSPRNQPPGKRPARRRTAQAPR